MGPKDCLYPHPNRCDQFIHCEVNADGVSGRPTVKDCPAGLEWNDNEKECDWPQDSTCRDVVQETLDTVTETLPPSDGSFDSSFSCSEAASSQGCMGSNGGGIECIYANPTTQDSYILCTDGLAYIVQCKSGSTYRDAIKACE